MSGTRKRKLPASDPDTGLVLPLTDIVPYENDPRTSPNAEYARIKASIRAQGLDQPLVVTRRPEADKYLIAAGGNTRLKILRELFEETRDDRYAQVTCVFKPWTSEADVMLAHLRENDLRGGLSFLDKAHAVRQVRVLLEGETGHVSLTQNELTDVLKSRGYALSQSSVSYMDYVVDVLDGRIPLALRAGLAQKEVIRLRALERATRTLWDDRVPDSGTNFDETFSALCQRYDSPDWNAASLRQALEAEIADCLNQSVHAVRFALDARLNGEVESALPVRDGDDEWPVQPEARPRAGTPKPTIVKLPARTTGVASRTSIGAETQAEPSAECRPIGDPNRVPAGVEPDHEGSTSATPAENMSTGASDLSVLRAEAAELAHGLANRHGLDDLIVTTSDSGSGFLVIDVPQSAVLEQLDEARLAQVSMIWWQLAACAEVTVAPVACLLPSLLPAGILYRALEDHDAGLLFNALWTLDPGQIGFRLWRTLSEQDWSDLLALMACYRNLHRLAAATGVELWSPPA